MTGSETIVLSLTGPASHTFERVAGQGGLSIGPVVPGVFDPDVIVGADDVLDWSTFEEFTVPAGYPWPRGFTYRGSDISFLAWSQRRRIEHFHWTPTTSMTVDGGTADITRLSVGLRDAELTIVLPAATVEFTVSGDLALLQAGLAAGGRCPGLFLYPDTRASRAAEPLILPPMPGLAGATSVFVGVQPLRQAFDCASLLQFPDLTSVRLLGRLANLQVVLRAVPGPTW